ncbi:MAG: IS3 family transposase [Bacteroidota bacterium]
MKTVDQDQKVARVCRRINCSRQNYYKACHKEEKATTDSKELMELIQPIRAEMPRIGGKKLYFMIGDALEKKELKIGRDRFFKWLGQNDLLIRPKRMYVHTTNSHHRFWIHDNLTADIVLDRPNKLWVSDITYIRTLQGNYYLALITDAYSRKIVGYDISDSLELEGCKRALESALQTASDLSQLTHHSDRGIQYCSNQYTDKLKEMGIQISMAAKGNCYENALAERVNGILKNEFNLDYTFKTKALAMKAVRQSIYIYNERRPHWAINLQTPQQKHAA